MTFILTFVAAYSQRAVLPSVLCLPRVDGISPPDLGHTTNGGNSCEFTNHSHRCLPLLRAPILSQSNALLDNTFPVQHRKARV